MPLELPEELLALIVDFVTENKDKRTLSRLALVSRALLTHVRQHRSAEIKIIITAGACTCLTRRYVRRLRDIIVADPSFAACITSIHLVEQSSRRMGGGSFEWLTRSDADGLADILQSLVSLRRLLVINESDDFVTASTSTDWCLIDVAVQRALLNLFSLPSLETLVLKRITNMELTPLIGRSNLKELTLRSVSLSDRDLERMQAGGPVASLSVGERASKGRLESIEFAGCGITLQKLLTGLARDDAQLDASYLRRLHVHSFLYDSAAESAIQELLLKCAVHLERLSFSVSLRLLPERPKGELRALDCLRLHQLPLVQTLDVEFQIPWHFLPIPQPYTDAIVTALRNLSHESLQVLRLTFTLPPTLFATNPLERNTSKGILEVDLWEQMDSMARECLAGMESLEIVVLGKRRSPDLANLVNNLYSRMPNLSSKNILHVNWYVDLAVILFDFVE
ncbi:hypothetical protein DFP72DRAFT_76615 [Ephemerocybe angulata]|uniref:F-box domain-containing protein n=1 Tax=Ephemerocybe angulata TaxID=980116 RepID=A0A8H6I801_9AGAR|nr:hypothetical protein DFP72DRAFT_76615 [Tulosesus angulatus]